MREYFRLLIGEAYQERPLAWCGRFLLVGLGAPAIILGLVVLGYLHNGGDAATAKEIAVWGFLASAVLFAVACFRIAHAYWKCGVEYRRAIGK